MAKPITIEILINDKGIKTSKPLPAGVKISFISQSLSHAIDFVISDNTTILTPLIFTFCANPSKVIYDFNIHVGRNSQAIIIENTCADINNSALNTNSTLHLADNAKVEHYITQTPNTNFNRISRLNICQGTNSCAFCFNLDTTSIKARYDLNVKLQGIGANCELNGVYLLANKQNIHHFIRVEHLASHTTSNEYYKGIINDEAHGAFHARVYVKKDIEQIIAHQNNHNLLLSSKATIDTKPELEIYADDVQCTHGATVGQLDQNALFYLRSRGITEDMAKSILQHAFIKKCFDRIKNKTMRKLITEMGNV